MYFQDIFPFR